MNTVINETILNKTQRRIDVVGGCQCIAIQQLYGQHLIGYFQKFVQITIRKIA